MQNARAPKFEAGTLRRLISERVRHALACGALAPIETEQEAIDDRGVHFLVRRVAGLARKAEQRTRTAAAASREFPVDADLFVAEVSANHIALLNKFPVIADHLLLVTRAYAPQETLLDLADFEALAACMREYNALAFYNGGSEAGASQAHKHLQLVPLPLAAERAVPMATLFDALPRAARRVPGLPFRHAFCRIEEGAAFDGALLARSYRDLLAATGIEAIARDGEALQSAPYNLLLTREWMLLVPRLQERFHGISINALGFAGSIFVKNDAELARVREAGPMTVLAAVADGQANFGAGDPAT